jgi:hypothetical protein
MRFPKCAPGLAVVGFLIGAQTLTGGTVLLSSDFETSLPAEFSGAGAREGTENFPLSLPAFGSWFLRNSTGGPAAATTVVLNSIPVHDALNIYFVLAVIDSWDGSLGDTFNVTVDGSPVFSSTYSNFDGDLPYGGSRLFFGPDRGFNALWTDSAYAIGLTVPHTSPTATIEFFASGSDWAGGLDESWAIDNLEIATVPEPASIVLAFSAIAMLALKAKALRKNRRALN